MPDNVEVAREAKVRKRDEIWQLARVVEARASVLAEWQTRAAAVGAERMFREIEVALGAKPSARFEDEVKRFANAAAAVSLSTLRTEGREAARYFRIATGVLHRAGVRTRGSRLSALHEGLRADLANAFRASRSHAKSAWREELRKSSAHLLLLAEQSLEELGATGAQLALLEAELDDPSTSELAALRLARARTLRLSGAFAEAKQLLDGLAEVPHALVDRLAYERAEYHAMQTGSLDALFQRVREDATRRDPQRLLLMWLWSHAVESKAWWRDVPKAASIARRLRDAGEPRAAAHAAEILERAYRTSLPLEARIHAVTRMAESVEDIADISLQLLTLGAASRWLLRAKQRDLATMLGARYETTCLSLSEGKSTDLFSLALPTVSEEEPLRAPRPATPDVSVARELSFGKIALELFKTRAASWGSAGGDDERVHEYAETLAYHFSVLKGPAMKIGQLMSYYGFALPPEAERVLRELQDAATPIDFATVKDVIESDFGRPMEQVFRHFDASPLAAGSIGQVHAAELVSGESVVVKVQYPGMLECIRRDFRSLKLVLPLVRSLLPGWDLEGILEELRARMVEECDYRHEAAMQAAFRARFEGDEQVVIPAVFQAFVTPRVLVTERFFGERFVDFVARASQAERDRAAATIVRYVVRTTIRESFFNTDMQPGNLLFAEGRVAFVDFGNVRRWESGEGKCWSVILHALLWSDVAELERGLTMAGLVDPTRPLDVAGLHEAIAGHLMKSVVVDHPQRIDKQLLMAEMRRFGPDMLSEAQRMRIPPMHVYGFRIYWGMFAVIADLGAEINSRRVVLAELEQ